MTELYEELPLEEEQELYEELPCEGGPDMGPPPLPSISSIPKSSSGNIAPPSLPPRNVTTLPPKKSTSSDSLSSGESSKKPPPPPMRSEVTRLSSPSDDSKGKAKTLPRKTSPSASSSGGGIDIRDIQKRAMQRRNIDLDEVLEEKKRQKEEGEAVPEWALKRRKRIESITDDVTSSDKSNSDDALPEWARKRQEALKEKVEEEGESFDSLELRKVPPQVVPKAKPPPAPKPKPAAVSNGAPPSVAQKPEIASKPKPAEKPPVPPPIAEKPPAPLPASESPPLIPPRDNGPPPITSKPPPSPPKSPRPSPPVVKKPAPAPPPRSLPPPAVPPQPTPTTEALPTSSEPVSYRRSPLPPYNPMGQPKVPDRRTKPQGPLPAIPNGFPPSAAPPPGIPSFKPPPPPIEDGPEEVYDDVENATQQAAAFSLEGVTTGESNPDGPDEIYDDVQTEAPPPRPPMGPPSFRPPLPPEESGEMYEPHPDLDQGPLETYEPFDDHQQGGAAGPIEDYELPEVVAERARALQLQQQMESEEPPLLPPQNDNRKLSKSELKDLKKKEKEREKLEREAKKREEIRQKARKKNLSSKAFKVFSLSPEVVPAYETSASQSNNKSKDNLLLYQAGETIFVLLISHEKLPPNCYLGEKEDGTVGFIAQDHLVDSPPPGVATVNSQIPPSDFGYGGSNEDLYEEVPGGQGGNFMAQPPPPSQPIPPAVPAPRVPPSKAPSHHPPPSFKPPLPPEEETEEMYELA